ncbi:DUF808 domain-containing protein [Actinomyces massiliensis]|jgi:hypothetical protein avisC_08911|uniref:DUF808 domain-containing protein n=1 Tax=Actinomyces massiliensis TaxID=461393 RepID=UPI0002E58E8D|nr:DUF808 domain-containing protein [Actinomyces massiliensis]
MSGFFALLDDIATLAKMTLSTIDDTASMAVKASAKVSAATVDDVAATPQYVTGITPDRELPIIKKIALGSLRNKLLIILPIGLLLTAVAPALLPVALVIGGAYLCFEGGEKLLERFLHRGHASEEADPADEASIIKRAITTDFVLSTEIMLLALAEVQGESSTRRIVALVMVALLITFAVYGLVGVLIKLDDAGAHLADKGRTGILQSFGRTVVSIAPSVFAGIGVIGVVAMLWVGGHILATNLAKVGFSPLHHAIERAEELSHNPVLSWITGTAMSCLIGTVVGTVLALMWHGIQIVHRRHRA